MFNRNKMPGLLVGDKEAVSSFIDFITSNPQNNPSNQALLDTLKTFFPKFINNNNNSYALLGLAFMYKEGVGEKQDIQKAISLLNTAILLDNKYAMMVKALLDVENKNYEAATKLFEKALDLGGAFCLACLYKEGKIGAIDGKPDYTKAFYFYKLSIQYGHRLSGEAAYTIACMYNDGHILDKNNKRYDKAYKYCKMSAELGFDQAIQELDSFKQNTSKAKNTNRFRDRLSILSNNKVKTESDIPPQKQEVDEPKSKRTKLA